MHRGYQLNAAGSGISTRTTATGGIELVGEQRIGLASPVVRELQANLEKRPDRIQFFAQFLAREQKEPLAPSSSFSSSLSSISAQ